MPNVTGKGFFLSEHSGVASPKFWWANMFHFRRATLFCLGYRFSEHKMNRYAKNLVGEMAPWLRLCPSTVQRGLAVPALF